MKKLIYSKIILFILLILILNTTPIKLSSSVDKNLNQNKIVIILRINNKYIYVNGSLKEIDVPPQIIEGRTYLPIKYIVEPLGGEIAWDSTEKKVTIVFKDILIELWIGKNTAKVNGYYKIIDPNNPKVVPMIIQGRTMLPVRFVAENLGCQVDWNANTQTITIIYEEKIEDIDNEYIIANNFDYPIDMTKIVDETNFGIWYVSSAIIGYHLGVDLETNEPVEIYSIGDGYIKYVRLHEGKNSGIDYHSKIIIEHKLPDGRFICSVYYHLDETTLNESIKSLFTNLNEDKEIILKKPIKVNKRYFLGKITTINNQKRPHLHFGIRSDKFDETIVRNTINGYYGYTKYTEVLAVWWSPKDFIETYKNGFKESDSITIKIKYDDSKIRCGPSLNYEQIALAKNGQIFVAFEKKIKEDNYYWYHIWLPSYYGTAQGWIREDLVEKSEENIIEVVKDSSIDIYKYEDEILYNKNYSKIYYKQKFVPIKEFNNGYVFYTPDYYVTIRNGFKTNRDDYPIGTYNAWVKIDDKINFIKINKKEYKKEWQHIGLENKEVRSIAIDPYNSDIIYAATFGDGVYKSVDRGKTWIEKNNGIDYKVLMKITIDPNNSNVIYTNSYKSLDGGNKWFNFTFDFKYYKPKLPGIYTLEIDPKNTNIIYCGTVDGLYKSIDSATSFFLIGNGLENYNYYTGILEIAVDSVNTNTLYVFVDHAPKFSGGVVFADGIFKSNNGGLNFQKILDLDKSEYVESIIIDPKNNNIIYISTSYHIYRSIDGGNTWKIIDKNIIYCIVLDYNQNVLYGIGRLGEFYKSYDKGESWVIDNNFENINFYEITISTITYDNKNRIIYLGTYNGIYKLEL